MSAMSVQPAPALEPVRVRSEQDRLIANLIAQARQLIEIARDDPEIAALLAGRGFDPGKLAEGLGLQEAAQDAFTARQAALAARRRAVAANAEAEIAARQAYADFRRTVRAIFRARGDRTGLTATGLVPRDVQRFLTTARASYAAAFAEPYAPALAIFGYPPPAIAFALATLDALGTSGELQNAALGAATRATAERDAAVMALDAWVRQFRQIARVALRGRPDLALKLAA